MLSVDQVNNYFRSVGLDIIIDHIIPIHGYYIISQHIGKHYFVNIVNQSNHMTELFNKFNAIHPNNVNNILISTDNEDSMVIEYSP